MRGINSFFLLGTVRGDPDQLTSKAGKTYVKFEIEVVTVRRVNGNDEEQHEIVPVTAFGKLAEIIMNYVKHGDPIHVVAHINSTEFRTDTGAVRRSISVVADAVQLIPIGPKQDTIGQSRPAEESLPKLKKVPLNELGEPKELPF
jgi:single-stranded DNA-binding protein